MNEASNSQTVHYRIYVYTNSRPPLGEPVAVSLCPWRRGRNGPLTGDVTAVSCSICLRHINELGIP
jgi:hypothetical protein